LGNLTESTNNFYYLNAVNTLGQTVTINEAGVNLTYTLVNKSTSYDRSSTDFGFGSIPQTGWMYTKKFDMNNDEIMASSYNPLHRYPTNTYLYQSPTNQNMHVRILYTFYPDPNTFAYNYVIPPRGFTQLIECSKHEAAVRVPCIQFEVKSNVALLSNLQNEIQFTLKRNYFGTSRVGDRSTNVIQADIYAPRANRVEGTGGIQTLNLAGYSDSNQGSWGDYYHVTQYKSFKWK
jgi:hypothetical protein